MWYVRFQPLLGLFRSIFSGNRVNNDASSNLCSSAWRTAEGCSSLEQVTGKLGNSHLILESLNVTAHGKKQLGNMWVPISHETPLYQWKKQREMSSLHSTGVKENKCKFKGLGFLKKSQTTLALSKSLGCWPLAWCTQCWSPHLDWIQWDWKR